MYLPTYTTGDLMKPRKHLAGATVSHALNLIVAGGFYMGYSDPIDAAEKKLTPGCHLPPSPVKWRMHCWDPII